MTTIRLFALFLIAVVVSGGVYTYGTLQDQEIGSVGIATGQNGTTAGNATSNPMSVCAAGNSICQMDASAGGAPSQDQDGVDQVASRSLLHASVAQERTRLR